MCETYIFAVSHRRPWLQIRQDKIMANIYKLVTTRITMKLISARSLKPAILFDFVSNALLSCLSVLFVLSSAGIIVGNKRQGILRYFNG